jgi:hypothetical protein
MGVGSSCLAKGTCGESTTRKNKSASKSATRSAKRSRATNSSVTLRNTRQTRSAEVPTGYLRGITAFKRHGRGNTVANININHALKAMRIGDKLSKKVMRGESLTPAQKRALKLYLNAASE